MQVSDNAGWLLGKLLANKKIHSVVFIQDRRNKIRVTRIKDTLSFKTTIGFLNYAERKIIAAQRRAGIKQLGGVFHTYFRKK